MRISREGEVLLRKLAAEAYRIMQETNDYKHVEFVIPDVLSDYPDVRGYEDLRVLMPFGTDLTSEDGKVWFFRVLGNKLYAYYIGEDKK